MAFIPQRSVLATQGTVPWSVLGAVTVTGSVLNVATANQSVSGTVNVGNLPVSQNVNGSVVAFQGTNPWIITGSVQAAITPAANQSVSGTVQTDVRGSVATVIIGGSIAASFTPPANQSVSGTVGASLIGLSPVSVSNFPTTQNVSGSVVATVTNTNLNVSGSVAAWLQSTNASVITVGSPVANQSVSGTVGASVIGHAPVVIVGGSVLTTTGNSSVQVLNFPANQSVSGTVQTTQSGTWSTSVMTNVITSIATAGQVMGSVAALQGTNPWTVRSSIAGGIFPISGSVAGVVTAWVNPSIVGTYQEDAAHTSADRGLFVLGVRNDTVSSFMGANGEYGPFGIDSAGRSIIKPFAAGEASLIANTSIVSTGNTASVVLFAAPGAGLNNYITDFNVSNTGGATTLVGFNDADASVFAKTIAPAGGGSNHSYATPPRGPTANKATTVQIFTASSVVHLTVTGFRAP